MKRLVVVQSVETKCDHDFVEYFKKLPNRNGLYAFRLVKPATSFTISIVMRSMKSQQILYQLKKLDGCQFLKNQFLKKMLADSYTSLIVNNSFFKCPIAPKVYYLKNISNALVSPTFHPTGYYQLSARMQMPETSAPFVMEIVWKYNVYYK